MRRVSVILSFAQIIRRVKKKNTPLAPVLFGASGYMIALTAEQKILDASRSFGCVGTHKGGIQGELPGEFSSLWGGPKGLPRGMSA